MSHFLYILKSQIENKSYVGITNNLERRLLEHNSGKSFYTKRYLPWEVIYKENCDNLVSARKREKYFKSCTGRKMMRNIFENL